MSAAPLMILCLCVLIRWRYLRSQPVYTPAGRLLPVKALCHGHCIVARMIHIGFSYSVGCLEMSTVFASCLAGAVDVSPPPSITSN